MKSKANQSIARRQGDRIKRARECRGITRQQLADTLGVTYDGVQKWETGARLPSVENARSIRRLIGVPVVAAGVDSRARSITVIQVAGVAVEALVEALDGDGCGDVLDATWVALASRLGYTADAADILWGLPEDVRLDSISGQRLAIEPEGDALRVAVYGSPASILSLLNG